MKHVLLEKSTIVVTILGGLFLILAAMIWYEGTQESRKVEFMAEQLSKDDYAGGGWYPANGTDYDLEARIVGQEGWAAKAINVKRGDQVEVRLRIASGNQLSSTESSARNLTSTWLSDGLTEVTSQGGIDISVHRAVDVPHIAYVPVGTYQVETSWLRDGTGQYAIGVIYDGIDDTVFRKIIIVPPDSEIDFHLVVRLAIASLVCFFILVPITILISYRYEKKCYAW